MYKPSNAFQYNKKMPMYPEFQIYHILPNSPMSFHYPFTKTTCIQKKTVILLFTQHVCYSLCYFFLPLNQCLCTFPIL